VAAVTKQLLSPCSAASVAPELGRAGRGTNPAAVPQRWEGPGSRQQAPPCAGSGRGPAPAPQTNPSFGSHEHGKPADASRLTESDGGTGRRGKSEINPGTAAEEL